MVKKRFTYEFFEFVMHRFSTKDTALSLRRLFNRMTPEEKLDIASGSFDAMWFRLYRKFPESSESNKARNAYENIKKNYHILHILNTTGSSECVWEIPKGKMENYETPINAAVRELYEETGFSPLDYKIMDISRRHQRSDRGITYVNEYYMGWCNDNRARLHVDYGVGKMTSEVLDIRWMSLESIRSLEKNQEYHQFCRNMFAELKTMNLHRITAQTSTVL